MPGADPEHAGLRQRVEGRGGVSLRDERGHSLRGDAVADEDHGNGDGEHARGERREGEIAQDAAAQGHAAAL